MTGGNTMGTAELREKLEAARNTFEYRLEKTLLEVAEQVCELIESQGLTRSELAQRLAVTPAYITKLLNGNPNLTIESLLKLSDALGQTLDIHFTPKPIVAQSISTALALAPGVLRIPGHAWTFTTSPAHGTRSLLIQESSQPIKTALTPAPGSSLSRAYPGIESSTHIVEEQPNEVRHALALAA